MSQSLEEDQVHLAWVHAVVLLSAQKKHKTRWGNMSLETNGHLCGHMENNPARKHGQNCLYMKLHCMFNTNSTQIPRLSQLSNLEINFP